METTPYRFFDYVALHNKVYPGDIINTDPILNNIFYNSKDYDYINIQTKGRNTFEKLDTGGFMSFEEGESTFVKELPDGRYRILNDEYYEFWCVSPFTNTAKLPLKGKFDYFKLLKDEERQIPKDTRLFLMEGSISIGDSNFNGINRITFSSGNKKVKALRNSYGLIVL